MSRLRDASFDVYTDVQNDEYTTVENNGVARRFCARDHALLARAALAQVIALAKNVVSDVKHPFFVDAFEQYRLSMHKLHFHPRTHGIREFLFQCEFVVLSLFSDPGYSENAMKAFDNWCDLYY